MSKLVSLLVMVTALVYGQSIHNAPFSPVGPVDAGGAASTIPFQMGSSLPGTCSTGMIYFLTTALPGDGIHSCKDNVWVQHRAQRSLTVELFAADVDTATGEVNLHQPIPPTLVGLSLLGVWAQVATAGTTNVTSVQIIKCPPTTSGNACSGTNVDMLSTAVSVDSGENSSADAATPAAINATHRLMAAGNILKFNVTGVSTTAAKGLSLVLTFGVPEPD